MQQINMLIKGNGQLRFIASSQRTKHDSTVFFGND